MSVFKYKRIVLGVYAFISILLVFCGCTNNVGIDSTIEKSNTIETSNTTSSEAVKMMATTSVGNEVLVHFIDVGQADCILIQSNGQAMLIDAGTNEASQAIQDYLNALGITRLEYVIGTHPHEDHIGSLDDVITMYDVGTVILPDKIHTTKTFEDVLDVIENKGLVVTIPHVGDVYTIGNATFTVLSPDKDYGDELNNWSVVIRLEGCHSFLLTGDAEKLVEKDILAAGLDVSADVLKVGHHGSDTSSSEAFLEAVHPAYAVISCGVDNIYSLPTANTLERLASLGIKMFRTDEQGTIIVTSNEDGLTFNTEPSTSMKAGTPKSERMNETKAMETEKTQASVQAEKLQDVANDGSEAVVHITKSGIKYHSSGCSDLSKSDIEISLEDAIARGYKPCSKCDPPQ